MHTLSLHSKFNNSSKVNSKLNTVAQPYLPRYLSYAMPQDSFTRTNQVPTQNQKEEYYRNLETIEKLDLRGEKIKSLPNLTNVKELLGPGSLEKMDKLQTAGVLSIRKTKIKSLPELTNVKELFGPKSLEEVDKLQTAGLLHIGQTEIKSLPKLTNVEELWGSESLEKMDKLQTAGVLNIKQTRIKSLPELTNVKKELWAPWTLGEDILKVGCPKLTNVKSILVINKSNLACKDFPSLIQIGEDNKIFHFKGNKNIETIDNLLQLVNKNRQEKGLLPLEAQHIESDQYKIIYPEENSTSNQMHDMQFKSSRYSDLQDKSINYSYSDSGYDDLGLHTDRPNLFDLRDESIHYSYSDSGYDDLDLHSDRPNLFDFRDESIYYSYSDSEYDDLDLHSDRPNLFDLRDESIYYSYSDSGLNKYNNQNKNINYFG